MSKKKAKPFAHICHKTAKQLTQLIEHPECSKRLRAEVVKFAYAVQELADDYDSVNLREWAEVRCLLPHFLATLNREPHPSLRERISK